MNVLDYFSLNEQPFRLGPDPRYLFYSGQVKEAIAKCEYMARDRVGPIYMYGPIGSGKTSILRRLNERLGSDEKYTVAYVIAPNVRRSEEHTSELQSRQYLVCRLLLEKKKILLSRIQFIFY